MSVATPTSYQLLTELKKTTNSQKTDRESETKLRISRLNQLHAISNQLESGNSPASSPQLSRKVFSATQPYIYVLY